MPTAQMSLNRYLRAKARSAVVAAYYQ